MITREEIEAIEATVHECKEEFDSEGYDASHRSFSATELRFTVSRVGARMRLSDVKPGHVVWADGDVARVLEPKPYRPRDCVWMSPAEFEKLSEWYSKNMPPAGKKD